MSRLGHPLVNEVVIGLRDKDRFNNSRPRDDGQFASYVTNPTMPVIIQTLFGLTPPCLPRNDLVQIFLTGIPGLNSPKNVKASEMLRLNTSIAVRPQGSQKNLGVLAGDLGGYLNGRRPGDDVVDIELRALIGAVISDSACAPDGQRPLTDGALVDDSRQNRQRGLSADCAHRVVLDCPASDVRLDYFRLSACVRTKEPRGHVRRFSAFFPCGRGGLFSANFATARDSSRDQSTLGGSC